MLMYERTRDTARAKAAKYGRKWVDCGSDKPFMRRWAVDYSQKVIK